MVLESYNGVILSECEGGKWDLPYYVVHNNYRRRREFHGELGYMDALRYYHDILLAIYR